MPFEKFGRILVLGKRRLLAEAVELLQGSCLGAEQDAEEAGFAGKQQEGFVPQGVGGPSVEARQHYANATNQLLAEGDERFAAGDWLLVGEEEEVACGDNETGS